ncbi:HAMP domain-containing sensor histidine kinase [Phenylobacterium sp.]|uniref:HAMP domain-containing sensor histidine kinase n=1 Tax=Phenylobacterium sp. TaxID=1871053 RepID=UPI002DEC231E|nr:ATP-binding protein [Phenylobacterium sp.]
MSPLFARIWLSFWAVLAITFLLALGVDYGLAVRRAGDIDRLSPQALAASGAAAIARGGEMGGRHWILMQHNRLPELGIFIVTPDGRELTGRTLAEVTAALARSASASPFPTEVDAPVAGRPYRFVFQRTRSLAFDLWDILLQPWVLGALILSISGLGSAWLAGSVTGPIRRLQIRVRAIADGDLAGHADPRLARRGDEIGALARDVDHMSLRLGELIAAREAMLRDVSHELRAPLARLRAVADLARRRNPERDATLDRIDKEVDRLDAMIGQILRFSRLQAEVALSAEPVDLTGLVAEAVEDARLEAAARGRRVAFEAGGPLIVSADPTLARSAVDNILRNAVRFSPAGGLVQVALRIEGGAVVLEVLDDGPGVLAADLPHIFEAFHGEGSGAGLGLAITRRVATLHGGIVAARNRDGGGLAVTLTLPSAAAAAA